MPPYHPAFLTSASVQVASAEVLERYSRPAWKHHHPVKEEMAAFAGHRALVLRVSFYHGGDCLYTLDGIPGQWHEACLVDPGVVGREQSMAAERYNVHHEDRDGQPVVVVTDKSGVEHLVARHNSNEQQAEHMREVAQVLQVTSFEERYSFEGEKNIVVGRLPNIHSHTDILCEARLATQ